ncbi:hypothetical protein V1264_012232 [Littorina saxatilis]
MGLFEVNLDHFQAIAPNMDKSVQFNPMAPSYTVWEETTVGFCLTTYTPKPELVQPGAFYVTKVRDYDSCLTKPKMAYVFDEFHADKTNATDKKLFVGGAVTYAIKGDKSNFIIMTAIGESKIHFMPFGRREESVLTSVNQTMYLVQAKDIMNPQAVPPMPTQPKAEKSHNMRMTLPVESVQDFAPYVYAKTHTHVNTKPYWTMRKMEQLLSWIANGTTDFPSEEVMIPLQELNEMIRLSRPEELKQLLDMLVQSKDAVGNIIGPLKLNIFWNILSSAGTTGAANVILEHCLANYHGNPDFSRVATEEEKEAARQYFEHRTRCKDAVTSIGLYAPPSEKIVLYLIKLVQKTYALPKPDEEMKMVTLLSTGSVMGRAVDLYKDIMMQSHKDLENVKKVFDVGTANGQEEQLKKSQSFISNCMTTITNGHNRIIMSFIEELKKRFVNTTLDSDVILGLKALRNAHIPVSKHFLMTLLQDTLLRPSVRIAAAQAFEKFCEDTVEVVSILEEVLKNPSELPSVRIQAFRSLINVRAPAQTLLRLASSIRYEQDRQLSTYVWSSLNAMATSTFGPYRQVAAYVRLAMPFFRPVHLGLQDSHHKLMQMDIGSGAGMTAEYSLVKTPDFVTALEAGVYSTLFGKAMQISLQTEGIEQVFKQLMGPKGFFTNRNSVFDLLKRPKRATDAKSMIADIFKKLSIKTREIPPVRSYLNLQLKNKVVRFWDLSSILQNLVNLNIVEADINEKKMNAGIHFSQKTSGSVGQFHMELPTEAGFPVNLQFALSYSAKIKGSFTAGVDASVYRDTRGFRAPTHLKAGLYLNPQIVTASIIKVSVDSYIFQAGTLVHGLVEVNAPFKANATIDLRTSRLTTSLSPPVNSDMPVMKMEVKPYVYSRAIPNDVSSQQSPVNQRPLFYTMQPIVISNAARMQQISQSFGKTWLGYNMRLEAQYPSTGVSKSRFLPNSLVAPFSGRAYYALYIEADEQAPSALRADIRYFSKPRYIIPTRSSSMDGEEAPAPKIGACDSWFSLWCYATDNQEAAEQVAAMDDRTPLPSPPVPDFPDLGARLTFEAVKSKIESQMGQGIPAVPSNAQWGFIAVFDSNRLSEDGHKVTHRRSAVLEGIVQAWKQGQFHQAFLSFIRSPIPGYDTQPWKMAIKTTAVYPAKRHPVSQLIDPVYQARLQSDMLKHMQRKEHRAINKNFKQMLMTKLSEYYMKHSPSLDPEIVLDSVLPELVMQNRMPYVLSIRLVLKTLLPLAKQVQELKSELKDAFRIAAKENLLEELSRKVLLDQVKVMKLLKQLRKEPAIAREVITAAEYLVYKLSQCVVDLDQIMTRAAEIQVINNPKWFSKLARKMEMHQLAVYRFSLVALSNRPVYAAADVKKILMGAPTGNIRIEPVTMDPSRHSSAVINALADLTTQQLNVILNVWYAVTQNQPMNTQRIETLIETTANNMTVIDKFIRMNFDKDDSIVSQLLLQATMQHQIITKLMHVLRLNTKTSPVLRTQGAFERYALKVQTKLLLERGTSLQYYGKMSQTCLPGISTQIERRIMQDIKPLDRELLTLKQKCIRMPQMKFPWTADAEGLRIAHGSMQNVKMGLMAVREKLAALPGMPYPCVMLKYADTVFSLQHRVADFKMTLMSQALHPTQLTKQFTQLEQNAKDLWLSLSPIFDKYVTAESKDQPELFPKGNILISEGLLDITMIHNKQSRVLRQVHKFLFQFGTPPFRVVKRILQTAAEKSQVLLGQLESHAERVKISMQTSSTLSAYSIYAQFLQILQQQIDIYDILQQQLVMYAKRPNLPDILPQMEQARAKIAVLMKRASAWKLPDERAKTAIPVEEDVLPEEDPIFTKNIYDNVETVSYDQPWGADNQDIMSPVTGENMDQIASKIPATINRNGILFNVNITYGNQTYLGVQVHGWKSMEQMLWETLQFYPTARDSCVARAIQSGVTGRQKLEKCGQEIERRINSYHHLHISVATNMGKLPGPVDFVMRSWMRTLRHTYYSNTYINAPEKFIVPGTMQAILDFSLPMDNMQMYLMTSEQTTKMLHIPLCYHVKALYPFQNIAPIARLALKDYSNGHMPATCKVDRHNVKTNDGAVFSLPRLHRDCRTLLAMDCSSDMTFALNLQPVARGPGQILQILAEQREVKIVPDFMTDRVLMDGQDINLQFGSPIIKYKTIAYGRQAVAVVISRQKGGYIRVEYPLVGLDILFDFNFINIDMSMVYKNQLCGLCGNYDGQMTMELEGPKRTIFPAADDFFRSYIIPDASCPAKNLAQTSKAIAAAQDMPVNQPTLNNARYSKRPNTIPMVQAPLVTAEAEEDDFAEEFAQ